MLTVPVHYEDRNGGDCPWASRVNLNSQGQFHDLWDPSQKGPALPAPSWRHYPKIVFVTQTWQFVLFSKKNPDNLFFFLRETETIGNAHKGPVQSLKGLTVRLRLVSKCQSPKKF